MPKHPPCKSHQPGSLTCADGFVQSAYCSGIFGCPMCGGYDDKNAPACLDEGAYSTSPAQALTPATLAAQSPLCERTEPSLNCDNRKD